MDSGRLRLRCPSDAFSAALGVAISQCCYDTGEDNERAVLRKLLGELDLEGFLIQ